MHCFIISEWFSLMLIWFGLWLIESVWSVFVRGVRRKQVCYSQVVCGLGVGLGVSGRKWGAGDIAPHAAPGVQQ